jgi:hypothetical protein
MRYETASTIFKMAFCFLILAVVMLFIVERGSAEQTILWVTIGIDAAICLGVYVLRIRIKK